MRLKIIADLGILPDARPQRCPNEYRRNAHAWATLLAPLFRAGKVPASTG